MSETKLSPYDKYKASRGYLHPEMEGKAGAVSSALLVGGGSVAGLRGVGKILRESAAKHAAQGATDAGSVRAIGHLDTLGKKLGKTPWKVGAVLGAASIVPGYKGFKALAESRNKELDTKATSNPEFRKRLEQSPHHFLSHPATGGLLNAGADALTGNPIAAAANYVTGVASGIKSQEYSRKKIEALSKEAQVNIKSLLPRITPTAGTDALKAQATALKSTAVALPKPPMAKVAGVAGDVSKYIITSTKGLGSLAASGAKGFGKAFSGQEARGVVAKHTGTPLRPDKVPLKERFTKSKDVDKLYNMDDDAMRAAVKGTPHAEALERAINRRTGARALAGAAGIAGIAKLNTPEQEQKRNVYYQV